MTFFLSMCHERCFLLISHLIPRSINLSFCEEIIFILICSIILFKFFSVESSCFSFGGQLSSRLRSSFCDNLISFIFSIIWSSLWSSIRFILILFRYVCILSNVNSYRSRICLFICCEKLLFRRSSSSSTQLNTNTSLCSITTNIIV